MEKVEFKRFIDELKDSFTKNKTMVDKALNIELSHGCVIKISNLIAILDDYANKDLEVAKENKKYAVCYSGKPEITLTYILDSMIYNNRITLVINGYKYFNDVLVSFVLDSFKYTNIKNLWISYNTNYNEIYLRDNEDKFDKIVYIGGYFEYLQFKSFFRKPIEYNNYGFIKLFIDKDRYRIEFEKITKFACAENLSIETYNDVDDFISESREEDYSIVFCDLKTFNAIQKGLRAGTILVNAFPYDTYKFKIEH